MTTSPASIPSLHAHLAEYSPRLLADIGGTNARFALETAPGRIEAIEVLACAGYATLADALQAYLAMPQVRSHGAVERGAIAIANPVDGDVVRMTNHHWEFSIEALRGVLKLDTLIVVNDFSALAMGLPYLTCGEKRQVGGGTPVAHAVIGLLGAGTGLGVSGLVPPPAAASSAGEHWTALSSEGGHAGFCPSNETEVAILQFAWRAFTHVSAERLLSGPGIELIHRALTDLRGFPAEHLHASEIFRRGLAGECGLCDEVIETFCGMLGTMAGNLALTLGAQGGVYIGGGIVPRLGARFEQSCFRSRFEQKGRFATFLANIPTYVITAEYLAFVGASAVLSNKLGKVSSCKPGDKGARLRTDIRTT